MAEDTDEVILNVPENLNDLYNKKAIERHIFTKKGKHLPMYHCRPDGVFLARSSPSDIEVPKILIEKKNFIDDIILPAVGFLYSVYTHIHKVYVGTGFVTNKASENQHQHVMTAFHNVLPIKYIDSTTNNEIYDWPIVYFSNHYDGTFGTYDQWIKGGKSTDTFRQLEFNKELLLKWQNTPGPYGGDNAPLAAYFANETDDLIELVVVGRSNYSYLQLAQDSTKLPLEFDVICVGYPGQPHITDKEMYKSTPLYDPTNLPSYLPEIKTVSYGKIYYFDSDKIIVSHSCSTVAQNSGSPIIQISDNSIPANVVAVHTTSGVDDDNKTRNYNVAITCNYWIKKISK